MRNMGRVFGKKVRFVLAAAILLLLTVRCVEKPMLGRTSIAKLLKSMTLEQKALLLVADWNAQGSALETTGIDGLGIPVLSLYQLSGIDMQAMQSLHRSWNDDLAYEYGAAFARESEPYGQDACNASFLNLEAFPPYSCSETGQESGRSLSMVSQLVHGMDEYGMPVAVIHECGDTLFDARYFDRNVLVLAACNDSAQVLDALKAGYAIKAGREMAVGALCRAVGNGDADMADIDRLAVTVLEFMTKAMTVSKKDNELGQADSVLLSNLRVECHRQGTVLLKNDGVLPLQAGNGRISLYGLGAYSKSVRLDAGLEELSYRLEPAVASAYEKIMDGGVDTLVRKSFQYRADAISSQAAVVVLLDYPGESDMLASVIGEFHSKGRPVVMVVTEKTRIDTRLLENRPDAIVLIQSFGPECGRILAQVISGAMTAGGRLACPVRSLLQYGFGDGLAGNLTENTISN